MDVEHIDNGTTVDKGHIRMPEEVISLSSGGDPNSQNRGHSEVGSQAQAFNREAIDVEDMGTDQKGLPAEEQGKNSEKNGSKGAPDGVENRRKRVIKKRPEEVDEPPRSR